MEMPLLSLCLSLDLEQFHLQILAWAGGRGVLLCKRNHLYVPVSGALIMEQTVTCSAGFNALVSRKMS